MKDAVEAVKAGDEGLLARALDARPEWVAKGRLIVEAARVARPEVLGLLLARGADPNGTHRGYRPLHALIQERPHGSRDEPSQERLRCLEMLLESGADVDALGGWPSARAVLVAAFTGLDAFVRRLRPKPSRGRAVDVFAAAAFLDVAAIRRAVEVDARSATARDGGGVTALMCVSASRVGRGDAKSDRDRLEIAAALLDAGADPNATVKSWSEIVDVAYFAASAGHLDLFELLLERGADATRALPSAAWNHDAGAIDVALRFGADVDRAVQGDRPLLNDLVRWGQFGPALALLARGASPNVADGHGWTAVHQAASRGNVRALRALLAAGGDARARDADGKTPLDVARAKGNARVIAEFSVGAARRRPSR